MMLLHHDESSLMHGTCGFRLLVQVVFCRLICTGCYILLVQVDSDRLIVGMVDSVTMKNCLHLTFIFQGCWTGQRLLVVATFQL
jgi:hypothetical protein